MNIPILLYHSISDQATRLYQPWTISPREFESHVAYLCDQGFQPMTIDDLAQAIRLSGKKLPERPVLLTFDDGLADFLIGAMPVLAKFGFPATLFIATGYIDRTSRWLVKEGEQYRPMLSWKEIASLEGVCLGSHSHTHPQLDILSLLEARNEIFYSKQLLEQKLGIPINTFAYPHGYYSNELREITKSAGYSSACIVGHAMATDLSDLYTLPRMIIKSDVDTMVLGKYLEGVGLRRHGAWRTFLRIAWRIFRKVKKTISMN
jgi:peptidoglycan/xylan/chitin deacetylase (PgdA/CDA1 family)